MFDSLWFDRLWAHLSSDHEPIGSTQKSRGMLYHIVPGANPACPRADALFPSCDTREWTGASGAGWGESASRGEQSHHSVTPLRLLHKCFPCYLRSTRSSPHPMLTLVPLSSTGVTGVAWSIEQRGGLEMEGFPPFPAALGRHGATGSSGSWLPSGSRVGVGLAKGSCRLSEGMLCWDRTPSANRSCLASLCTHNCMPVP